MDVPEAHSQALDEGIQFLEHRKLAEEGMLWVSKGIVAAVMAVASTNHSLDSVER